MVASVAAYIQIIPGTGMIIGQDIGATIDEQLHEHSPELGLVLKDLVQNLTPILTGALISDITYEAYPDPGGFGQSDLVLIFSETLAQEAFWKRVYVAYQEGGLLGLPTYTNNPHEMFWETASGAGLDFVKLWATMYVQVAIDMCVIGVGVPV